MQAADVSVPSATPRPKQRDTRKAPRRHQSSKLIRNAATSAPRTVTTTTSQRKPSKVPLVTQLLFHDLDNSAELSVRSATTAQPPPIHQGPATPTKVESARTSSSAPPEDTSTPPNAATSTSAFPDKTVVLQERAQTADSNAQKGEFEAPPTALSSQTDSSTSTSSRSEGLPVLREDDLLPNDFVLPPAPIAPSSDELRRLYLPSCTFKSAPIPHHPDAYIATGDNADMNEVKQGKIMFSNGDVYEGDLIMPDVMHGLGTYVSSNGDTFRGNWVDGVRSGHGSMSFAAPSPTGGSNAVSGGYVGEWRNDLMHGKGCCKFSSGAEYTGEWANGVMQGQGVYRFPDGSSYVGACRKNRKAGYGVFLNRKGTRFSGHWRRDVPHGLGKLATCRGVEYVGTWHRGELEGQGRAEYAAGQNAEYVGGWSKSLRYGDGRLIFQSGVVFEGQWKAGLPSGNGTLRLADGVTFRGNWIDGTFNGWGQLSSADGSPLFEGFWSGGQREGLGRLFASNRRVLYSGSWAQGRPHGEGRIYQPGTGMANTADAPDAGEDDIWVFGRSSIEPSRIFTGSGFVTCSSTADVKRALEAFSSPDSQLQRFAKACQATMKLDTVSMCWLLKVAPALKFKTRENYGMLEEREHPKSLKKSVHFVRSNDGSIYTGGLSNGRPNGVGRLEAADGTSYHGQWSHGVADGMGRLAFADGSSYVGFSSHGVRCGYGIFVESDGSVYDGEWKCDRPHGYGVLRLMSGATYHGHWLGGVKTGSGDWRYPDGAEYSGEWSEDAQHGVGCMTYLDGSTYDGQWSAGKGHGWGRSTSRRGSVYEGRWHLGRMNGQGTYSYSRGSRYTGHWRANLKDGSGSLVFWDGARFAGFWKDNRAAGRGTFFSADGKAFTGVWQRGRLRREAQPSENSPCEVAYFPKHKSGSRAGANFHKESSNWTANAYEGPTPLHYLSEAHFPTDADSSSNLSTDGGSSFGRESTEDSRVPFEYWQPPPVEDTGAYISSLWFETTPPQEGVSDDRSPSPSVVTRGDSIRPGAQTRAATISYVGGGTDPAVHTERTHAAAIGVNSRESSPDTAQPARPGSAESSIPSSASDLNATSAAAPSGRHVSTSVDVSVRSKTSQTISSTREKDTQATPSSRDASFQYTQLSEEQPLYRIPPQLNVAGVIANELPESEPRRPPAHRVVRGVEASPQNDSTQTAAISKPTDSSTTSPNVVTVEISQKDHLAMSDSPVELFHQPGEIAVDAKPTRESRVPPKMQAAPSNGPDGGTVRTGHTLLEKSNLDPPTNHGLLPSPEATSIERVIEFPEIREKTVRRERVRNSKSCQHSAPTQHVEIEVPIDVIRKIPIPVESVVPVEFKLPRFRPRYVPVNFPVYAPRFVEVPVPVEIFSESSLSDLSFLHDQVQLVASHPAPSVCEIQKLAEAIQKIELPAAIAEENLRSLFEETLAKQVGAPLSRIPVEVSTPTGGSV